MYLFIFYSTAMEEHICNIQYQYHQDVTDNRQM